MTDINRSTYYDGNEFRHDDRIVRFQRTWGGISFEGLFIVVIGEEQFFTETRYYTLCEAQLKTMPETLLTARVIEASYGVDRWCGYQDDNVKEFVRISNMRAYKDNMRALVIFDAPRVKETIDPQIATVLSLIEPTKYLYFFGQSALPSEMKSLPIRNIKAVDYPKVAALASVINGMLKYGHEVVADDDVLPDAMGWGE